ncbi:MAG: carbohydrate ABC transporter permease [Firmicutes bacterium]|nr:carbohydrate ABC transporter permease [Bacillota bacterium]
MKRIVYIFVVLISLMFLFPIAFTVANSLMPYGQVISNKVNFIPNQVNLQQYYSIVINKTEYFKFFLNSVKITSLIIFGQIFLGILAAFAFAKMKFPGSDILFMGYVFLLLLPYQVVLVPNFLFFDKVETLLNIKIFDTHLALILPGMFYSFGVFILRQFIRGIPDELIEAAKIDGAGYATILIRIILPMLKPAIFTLVILTFIDNWNLIDQAVAFIETPEKMPLSVFLNDIYDGDKGVFFAGAVLYIIPAILIFTKGEKYLKEGLILGGDK